VNRAAPATCGLTSVTPKARGLSLIGPIPEAPSGSHPLKPLAPIQGGRQMLEWTTEGTPEVIVLRPTGEVDLATVSEFRERLIEAVKANPRIVVDMSGVQYIDSTGVKAFGEVHKVSQETGHNFVLVVPPGVVKKVLTIIHIDAIVPILPTLQDAVNSFAVDTRKGAG
jgi:anti-sigma B factor antagonist